MTYEELDSALEQAATRGFDSSKLYYQLLETKFVAQSRGADVPAGLVHKWRDLALFSSHLRGSEQFPEWLGLASVFLDCDEPIRGLTVDALRSIAATVTDTYSMMFISDRLANCPGFSRALDLLEELPALAVNRAARVGIPSAWRWVLRKGGNAERQRAFVALRSLAGDRDEEVREQALWALNVFERE